MTTLTVSCPQGFPAGVLTDAGQVAVYCSGYSGVPAYVVNSGCPADFPMCGSGSGPLSVADTVQLSGSVLLVWAVVWSLRNWRRTI